MEGSEVFKAESNVIRPITEDAKKITLPVLAEAILNFNIRFNLNVNAI